MGWFGHSAGDYFFEYDTEWLQQPGGFVLAPQFALAPARYTGALVRHFFENLLPEGEALDDIMAALQLRGASYFEVLGKLGAELPGVLSLLPPDARPQLLQQYTPLPYEALSQRLATRAQTPLLVSNTSTTMSLAGAQDKMGLRLDSKTLQLFESVGQSPTTHILKPDTRQTRYTPSAINEFACMQLARALKLPVPATWLLRVPDAVYMVERYDRRVVAGNIVGLHQIDGCQLLGHGAGWKYERMGGLVSIAKLVHTLRTLHIPGGDMLQLQRWVMFNYLIGNADAHAKNLSVLIDDQGYRLAPFYDLLSSVPMHCSATWAALYSPPLWYQRPIQLSAPAITKAVIFGSHGASEPSCTPCATRRRNAWSISDFMRRSSVRLGSGTSSSPTRIRHMPNGWVTMSAYTCMQRATGPPRCRPPGARPRCLPASSAGLSSRTPAGSRPCSSRSSTAWAWRPAAARQCRRARWHGSRAR
jgi:serine/threonine-protein kinase HipA